MAPITPFITEELYQKYYKKYEKNRSIHLSKWPEEIKIKKGKKDSEKWNLLTEMLSKVRQEKSKAQKSMKSEIILTIEKEKQIKLRDVLTDLKAVTNAKKINEGKFKIEFL